VVCQEQRFSSILTGTFLWNPMPETDKSIVIAEIGCWKKYCLGRGNVNNKTIRNIYCYENFCSHTILLLVGFIWHGYMK
jgi:hypothetical protein